MATAAESGIIEPEELYDLLDSGTKVKLVDASYALPGPAPRPPEIFYSKRIGDAVFFDISAVVDRSSALPNMLPPPGEFVKAAGALGITHDDLVVIYGQTGIVMGPARAWWMFRVFGHENVCLLNGGLPEWEKAGYPLNTAAPKNPVPARYKANFRPDLVRSLTDVQNAQCLILDARAADRYAGTVPEPRPGLRSGHIPGSRNVPASSLIDPGTGKLKAPEVIRDLLEKAGFEAGKPVITSCGSGVTACVIALALYHIGHKEAAVYDGSWSEWGLESSPTKVGKT